MTRSLLLLALSLSLYTSGCSLLLGRDEYLFYAADVLAPPGQQVRLAARLEHGEFLKDQEHKTVEYYLGGQLLGRARTDEDGRASLDFTPAQVGDYIVRLECRPKPGTPVARAELLVCCRPSDTPLCVVDIDGTLVASGFLEVVRRQAQPMPFSVEAVSELARRRTIVYLTYRPTLLSPISKDWLAQQGYPRGPVFMAPHDLLNLGSRRYKAIMLADIRRRFTAPAIGIGDKRSDMAAYTDAGVDPYLVLHLEQEATAAQVRRLIRHVDKLPDPVHVAANWRMLDDMLLGGQEIPREQLRQYLAEVARRREQGRP